MEEKTFFDLLDRCVDDGCVEFVQGDRRRRVGSKAAPDAILRVHDARFYKRVLAAGNLGIGESYMDGDFEMEHGTIADFLAVLLRNRVDKKLAGAMTIGTAAKILWIRLMNRVRGRQAAISSHYDTEDDALFEACLDERLLYSCGYVKDPAGTVDQFQRDKLQRICEKLRLQPGERLVDIGCGYGGLLIYAAQNFGISGKGCTLGHRHYERAKANVAAAGLSDRIEIERIPFDRLTGTFDKLVSVEMIEHLRPREYGRFVDTVERLLEGRAMGLIQYIGCTERRNVHDPFIQKYILRDTSQPKLSQIVSELEEHDMAVLDVENLAPHYGYTMRAWIDNFLRNFDRLEKQFDERFKRMWIYYLECATAASSAAAGALYQVLFARNYPRDLPLHRV
jgi:cyclopropane-fatty-acyl-phospholipid synthase